MQDSSYPALYLCADETSNRKQKLYLRLIQAEYALLIIAAILSINVFTGVSYFSLYASLFIVSIFILLTRSLLKPEQDWYKCRALAESVKTITWRYMMRAAPFGDALQFQIPRSEFRKYLHKTFDENRGTAEKIVENWSAGDQITAQMDQNRALNLNDRKQFYAIERVKEQRCWYAQKAAANKKSAKRWVATGVISYTIAAGLALSRIQFPDWQLWPIEPIIVFASSVIGWMQIKKFNELGAAYSVTAQEIGLIMPKLDAVTSEPELSDFVNEAELAFSREHTLWIARQSG